MKEWISVKDRLPDYGQIVLIYKTYPKGTMFAAIAAPLVGNSYYVAEYVSYGNGFATHNYRFDGQLEKFVTHWMPLPEPPKE